MVVKVFYCLIESCIGCSKLILQKRYGHAKFCQQPIIELYTAFQNKIFPSGESIRENWAPREGNPQYGYRNSYDTTHYVCLLKKEQSHW